jgi:hypothetical protein
VGSSYASIVAGVRAATTRVKRQVIAGENPFGRGDAGQKIAHHLLGTYRRPAAYHSIEQGIPA